MNYIDPRTRLSASQLRDPLSINWYVYFVYGFVIVA